MSWVLVTNSAMCSALVRTDGNFNDRKFHKDNKQGVCVVVSLFSLVTYSSRWYSAVQLYQISACWEDNKSPVYFAMEIKWNAKKKAEKQKRLDKRSKIVFSDSVLTDNMGLQIAAIHKLLDQLYHVDCSWWIEVGNTGIPILKVCWWLRLHILKCTLTLWTYCPAIVGCLHWKSLYSCYCVTNTKTYIPLTCCDGMRGRTYHASTVNLVSLCWMRMLTRAGNKATLSSSSHCQGCTAAQLLSLMWHTLWT